MKVIGPGTTSTAAPTRRSERSGSRSGEFARHLENTEPASDATPLEGLNPLAAVDALLAAQSVTDSTDDQGRRRMVRRGEDILDKLEDIRLGLLTGGLPRERLIDLARMVRSRREAVADPRLAAILDEIELRAEVELAKYSPR